MYVVYVHVCAGMTCVLRGRRTLGILLSHAPPSWWPEILSVHHGTRLQTRMVMPSFLHGFCDPNSRPSVYAANALTHWTVSPDSPSHHSYLGLMNSPPHTCPFFLGARGYSSSQPCAHTGTAARPAHPIWEHRRSDN